MKNNLLLVIKGFIMGLANIIPGVSGGTLALILGIYEKFINAISHFFQNFKENLCFIIPVAIGMVLAILSMSRVIDYSYNHYPIPTTMFFMGLVIGGIPLLASKVKGKKESRKISSYVILLLTFSIVVAMACSKLVLDEGLKISLYHMNFIGYLLLFIVGGIAAATMVIPGVSGGTLAVLLGIYEDMIEAASNFYKSLNSFKKTICFL